MFRAVCFSRARPRGVGVVYGPGTAERETPSRTAPFFSAMLVGASMMFKISHEIVVCHGFLTARGLVDIAR